MTVFAQRFDFSSARHGFRSAFAPRKPRRPWMRVVLGLVGVAVLLALVFVSVFVGIAMLAVGVVVKLLKQRGKPMARDRHIDAEYQVVRKHALPSA
ncbi:MAG TPA: hypothetical protein VMS49_09955 [Lysobacter sp.]|jgi:hypothetical protein|nr:hypothetical protein [Lysobacter sp.]